jgi:hypothetical protein
MHDHLISNASSGADPSEVRQQSYLRVHSSYNSPTECKCHFSNDPAFEDIQVTTRLLNANAISVPSMAGGGAHGHLGIIMTQVEYAAISGTPWVEPFNPGTIPIIPSGTNAMGAAQIARMRDEFRRIYTNRINVDQSLKRIMIEAYDSMYTSQI